MIGLLGSGGIQLLPDSSVLYQLVVFLLAVAVLNHFVLKPALLLLRRREEATSGAKAKAESLQDEARRMEDEAASKVHGARSEAIAAEELKRREAESFAKSIIDGARTKANTLQEEEHRSLEASRRLLQQKLEREVPDYAALIIHQLVGVEQGVER